MSIATAAVNCAAMDSAAPVLQVLSKPVEEGLHARLHSMPSTAHLPEGEQRADDLLVRVAAELRRDD